MGRDARFIGTLVLLMCLLPGLAGRPAAMTRGAVAGAALERLAWLAGCWAGTLGNGATYEEIWMAPRAGSLLGMSRMSRGDATISFEFLRIADENGTLVYLAQPGGRPPTRFAATEITASTVTFANPAHDFPQRIRYRRTAPDALDARIEGERDGRTRSLDFPLRRVTCPA